MKKVGLLVLFAVASVTIASWNVAPVQAYPEFKKEFDKKYIKDPPTNQAETDLNAAVATAKCGVCHTGKTKKVRNTYGAAIEKLMPDVIGKPAPDKADKDALKKDTTKIDTLLDKAAAEHSDPADANSPTFGDLIKQGKLPGKDVEVAK